MPPGPVRIAMPPGIRACGNQGKNQWEYARDASGGAPWMTDLTFLHSRFPSPESKSTYLQLIRERMAQAEAGTLPWEFVTQMKCAPDVLEIRLQEWWFNGGPMHGRLYFSEPAERPGTLVALRFRAKRPGPVGLDEQDALALEASQLLGEYSDRGFQ